MGVLATHSGIRVGRQIQGEPAGPRHSVQFGSPEFRLEHDDRPRWTSSRETVGRVVAAGGRAVADRAGQVAGQAAGLAGPTAEIVGHAAKDFARPFIFALETLVF